MRYDEIEEVQKFNPYHDSKGRFASAPGGGGSALSPEKFNDDISEAKLYLYENSKDYFAAATNLYSKYQEGTANETNFFSETIATFQETRRPRRPPDHVSYGSDGKVSSEYWYSEDGVIRGSDHWGTGVSSCDWAFQRKEGVTVYGRNGTDVTQTSKLYGKAKWSDFLLKTAVAHLDGAGEVLRTFNNTDGKYHIKVNGKTYTRQNKYSNKWKEVLVGKSANSPPDDDPWIDYIID